MSLLLYQFTRWVIKLTNNCCRISLPSTSHKMLSNILLSQFSPQIDEIIGDYQYSFQHNINYRSDFLHSSDTGKKMGVQYGYMSCS
jgi:hypothetical protein